MKHIYLALTFLLLTSISVYAADKSYGDVQATFISAHDGDTITVTIPSYPTIIGSNISVRVYGCDTPELKDTRPNIHSISLKAKDFTTAFCESSPTLLLKNIRRDKYFRILADVYNAKGESLSTLLITNNLAKEYYGETKQW